MSQKRDFITNTSWIMSERIISMVVTFVLTILVARVLGPEDYGLLSYALSLVTLFAAAGHVGLNGIVVRELVKVSGEREKILGTSFVIKVGGYLVGAFLLMMYALFYEGYDSIEFWLIVFSLISLIFSPFGVVEYWFHANLKADLSFRARMLALSITSVLKIVLIISAAPVIMYAILHSVNALLVAVALVLLLYFRYGMSVLGWKFDRQIARELWSRGWLIYLGSVFAAIYLKIDQVMIKWFVGGDAVGIYAVASMMSEAWYFVPVAIMSSVFPSLIRLHETDTGQFKNRMQQVIDLLFMVSLLLVVGVIIFAQFLMVHIFGSEYEASVSILMIHICAAPFIFMRAAFSRWLLIEDAVIYSVWTHGLGAIMNVVVNAILIPRFGVEGAAWATVLSYAMASYISLLFPSRTRPVFWMMTKSIFSPYRYIKVFVRSDVKL